MPALRLHNLVRRSTICAIALASFTAGVRQASAQQAMLTLSGDGLTVTVTSVQGPTLSGQITRGGQSFPFTGTFSSTGDVETVSGTFTANGQAFPFKTTQNVNEETITFATGTSTYRLTQQNAAAPAPIGQPPVVQPPVAQPPVANPPTANAPAEIRLTKATFNDVNMGGVPAFTMLMPSGWSTGESRIEWAGVGVPYPQKRIEVKGPDNSAIAFAPAMTFMYWDWTPQAKAQQANSPFGAMPEPPGGRGEPPPQDIAQFIIGFIQKHGKETTSIRLVSDVRDAQAEQILQQGAGLGQQNRGTVWEVHTLTVETVRNGRSFTEQLHLTYARQPPINNGNQISYSWMLFPEWGIRAPVETFAAQKPTLMACVQSLRSLPNWWMQQYLARGQMIQDQHERNMAVILERGRRINEAVTPDAKAGWEKETAGINSDKAQNDRLNSIYEVEDYKDVDGGNVKLPIHYKNYYSNGKGDYIGTNSTTYTPPASEFTQINQAPR